MSDYIVVSSSNNTIAVVQPSPNNTVAVVQEKSFITVSDTAMRGPRGPSGPTGAAGLNDWVVKTTNYSANNRDRLIADTSGGSFTITLPSTPVEGDYIQITDGDNWANNILFIDPNGSTIEGRTGIMNVDVHNVTVECIYDGSEWQVTATLGARGQVGPTGPIGGSNTQILFNDSGVANGNINLAFNKTTATIQTGNIRLHANGLIRGDDSLFVRLGSERSANGINENSNANNVFWSYLPQDTNTIAIHAGWKANVQGVGVYNVSSSVISGPFNYITLDDPGLALSYRVRVDFEEPNAHWKFQQYTGKLVLPGDSALVPTGNNIDLVAGPDGWAELLSNNSQSAVWVDNNGAYVGTDWGANSYGWTFANTGVLNVPGDIIPNSNNTANLGSPEYQWNHLYVSSNTIYFDNIPLTINANGTLSVNNAPIVGGLTDRLSNSNSTLVLSEDGTVTFQADANNNYLITQQRWGMGNLVAFLDGGWTLGEYNGTTLGTQGIRINPGVEGYADISLPADQDAANGNPLTVSNYHPNGNVAIMANGHYWKFDYLGGVYFPILSTARGDTSGGTVYGSTLKFNDPAYQSIIAGPDGNESYQNAQRIVIEGGLGYTGTSGEGGDIYLWAGRGGDGGGTGGDIKIRGGYGYSEGGYIRVDGGDTAAGPGGYVEITGGSSATDHGGDIRLISGYGANGYGNVRITSVSSNWTFDNTGSLSLPNGSTIRDVPADANPQGVYLNVNSNLFQFDTGGRSHWPNDILINYGGLKFNYDNGFSGLVPYFGWVLTDSETLKLQTNVGGGDLNTDIAIVDRQSQNVTFNSNIIANTGGFPVGYRDIPQISFVGDATLALGDSGKHYYSTISTANTLTVPDNATVAFPIGATINFVNQGSANVTIANAAGVTLYLAGSSTAGNRNIISYGMATLQKVAVDTWFLFGAGVS